MSGLVSCALLRSADAIGVHNSDELPRNVMATAHVHLFLLGAAIVLVGLLARS